MSWLFEDSTPLLVVTVLAEILLIVSLLRTGKSGLLYVALVVAVIGGGCVAIEWLVETDGERVEQLISQTRRAVLSQDRKKVFALLAPDSSLLRSQATRSLSQFLVRDIKITDGPQIVVNRKTFPPTAAVELIARLDLEAKTGLVARSKTIVRVEARVEETSQGWRWTAAEFSHPLSR